MRLEVGKTLNFETKKVRVIKLLGEGGQGEVYLVRDGNKDYAFK